MAAAYLATRRVDRRTPTRAGVDPVHHHRPACGSVQLSPDLFARPVPTPTEPPATSRLSLTLAGGDRGTGHLPAGPPTDDRPGPDGPGRHRARRLGPVRRQRHLVPADSREHRRQQRVQPGGPGIRCSHCHRGALAVPARRTPGPAHPGPVRRRARLLRVLRLRLRAALQRAAVLHLRHHHRSGLDRGLRPHCAGNLHPGQPSDAAPRAAGRTVPGGGHGRDVHPVPDRRVAQPEEHDHLGESQHGGRPCCGWSCCWRSWPGRSSSSWTTTGYAGTWNGWWSERTRLRTRSRSRPS